MANLKSCAIIYKKAPEATIVGFQGFQRIYLYSKDDCEKHFFFQSESHSIFGFTSNHSEAIR